MLDVRRLRTLRELADRGTIAAAAEALHFTPSAVSQQLAALEAALGQPLLERTARSVRLTPAAHVVLRHADAMLVETERLEADLHALAAGRSGRVRIGAFPMVVSMESEHAPPSDDPRITRVLLPADRLDAALPVGHPLVAGDLGTFDNQGVTNVPHPAAVPLAALAGDTWIAPPLGWSCDHAISAACFAAGFQADGRHRASDWAAVPGPTEVLARAS